MHIFTIVTDHFQFMMGDRMAGPRVDTTHLWNGHEQIAFMNDAPEIVAIATYRYGGATRIHIEVGRRDIKPAAVWSRMGEFCLNIRCGEIIIWSPEAHDFTSLPTISVIPGLYNGIAYSTGIESISDERADEGPDEYYIHLWRSCPPSDEKGVS